MNEIDQLRQDIEKLENAMPIAIRLNADVSYHNLKGLKRELQDQIAKLEADAAAAADPWVYAKEQVKHLSGDGKRDIYNYARHLEQRVAVLQAELARRPKVYCVKTHEGIATTGGFSKVPRVFLAESIEDEYGDGAQHIEPYTGQQS